MKIEKIHALEILDSNGNPTIETTIELLDGTIETASVPSGASTGKNEVHELRDGDSNRYNGKGVTKAVEIVNNEIATLLMNKEFKSQEEFDNLLIEADGTPLKTKLGGNSILSCSIAFSKVVAKSLGLELFDYLGMVYHGDTYNKRNLKTPTPLLLVLEGGKHGNWATDIQEYMIIPNMDKFINFKEALRAGTAVYKAIEKILEQKEYSTGVGFEGAFAPKEIQSNKEAFDIILEGINLTGYIPGEDFSLAIDVASSEFYNEETKKYELRRENKVLDAQEWFELQTEWYSQYPIVSVEDPFEQDDWEMWTKFTEKFGNGMVVGDDLLTTNVKRIQEGIEKKSANTVLIKPNQIGTVTETFDAIKLGTANNFDCIISHRSGETVDSFIADLSVATPAKYCKFGGPNRGERVAKYNRLLEIQDILESGK